VTISEHWELSIKAAFTAAGFLAIVQRREAPDMPAKKAGPALIALAIVAAASYYNWGTFHGGGYVHHWETFHYVLGSKYFPELGYDGLYTASIAAERETHPRHRTARYVRDLRTNEVVPNARLTGEMRRLRASFSDERWEAFKRDNAYFIDRTKGNRDYMRKIRLDHGYNPSPFWTFIGRLFDAHTPITHPFIQAITCVDPLLLALMFAVVFRTYGARVGCISLIIFGLGYPWRFYWVGGAFLRYDWLAATVMGVCALKKERYALAGVLLAYGALVRVFPVLFLFGLGVVALRALVRREARGWILRFALGYAAMLAFGVYAGSTVGHGFAAWPEFIENSKMHTATWLTNNVGLQNIFLYGPDTYMRRLVDSSLPEPFAPWHAHLTYLRHHLMPLLVVAMGAMLALTAAAAWRSTPSEAAVLGLVPCFSLLILTCYYWSMLLLVPFRRGTYTTLATMVLSSLLILVHGLNGNFEVRFGVGSWAMLALFVHWILPDALQTFRRVPVTGAETGPEAERLNADMV
jgi:hypothetical protein